MTDSGLEERARALSVSVMEHLDSVSTPPASAGPQEILDALIGIRGRLDRVDAVLVELIGLKSMAARQFEVKSLISEEGWNQAVVNERNAPARRVSWGNGDDFQAPRERYAAASLSTLTLKRSELAAKLDKISVDSSTESVRMIQRSLDSKRQDLIARMRMLQFESTLER